MTKKKIVGGSTARISSFIFGPSRLMVRYRGPLNSCRASVGGGLPAAVGIVRRHRRDGVRRLFAEILLIHASILVDDERHDARRSILDGIRNEGEAPDHVATDHVAARASGRVRSLGREDAKVVAP